LNEAKSRAVPARLFSRNGRSNSRYRDLFGAFMNLSGLLDPVGETRSPSIAAAAAFGEVG